MAAPNIVGVTTITGSTAVLALTASAVAIVTNSGSSGKVYKVNSLYIANVDGSTAYTVTIDLYRSSTAYRLAYQVSVPAGSTLDVLSKPIYLEEGDSLRGLGSTTLKLEAICSYEQIS
jgi:hypothetical protein